MPYQVELLNFEGPLDLLLQVIERSELSVTDISLAQVTEQYLQYVSGLGAIDPVELSWFTQLASRLIHIKSLALLPDLSGDSEWESDHEQLQSQLQTYQAYQQSSLELESRLLGPQQSFSRQAPPPVVSQWPLPKVTLEQIQTALTAALNRTPPTPKSTIASSVTLDEVLQGLRTALSDQPELTLSQLFERARSRLEAVLLFLGLLELIRHGQVRACQSNQFGDIILVNETAD